MKAKSLSTPKDENINDRPLWPNIATKTQSFSTKKNNRKSCWWAPRASVRAKYKSMVVSVAEAPCWICSTFNLGPSYSDSSKWVVTSPLLRQRNSPMTATRSMVLDQTIPKTVRCMPSSKPRWTKRWRLQSRPNLCPSESRLSKTKILAKEMCVRTIARCKSRREELPSSIT